MEMAILEMPPQSCEVGTLGAFFDATEETDIKLLRSEERLMRDLVSVLDNQLLAALDTRSLEEFSAMRQEVWPKYVRSIRALSETMSNLMSREVREKLCTRALKDVSSDIEKQQSRFGDNLTQQAVFTCWTFGRMRMLGNQILRAGDAPKEKREADLKLAQEYFLNSQWASFHLDLVIAAMKFDRPFPAEVREAACDGLRSAVNAYAIMKDALFLRTPRVEESPTGQLPWDEEDERLLSSSMRGINDDFSEGS